MGDGPTTDRPFFFVHVMKTAGMTFNAHIHNNFARAAIYPGADDLTGVDYWVVDRLREAVRTRRHEIRLWHGHFPYFVTDLVPESITLSVLREPVARTISLIDQHRRLQAPEKTIEEIYEDPLVFSRTILDHQTKIFSMAESDNINAWTQSIDVDEARLEAAKARLGEIDVLGFQETFDEFLATLDMRWGWRIEPVDRVNSADEKPVVSESFRQRIIDDNRFDMELYEFARSNF
ncbi:MAG: hypothetical protein R2707_19865 [Acidimicrobiales bacterium]